MVLDRRPDYAHNRPVVSQDQGPPPSAFSDMKTTTTRTASFGAYTLDLRSGELRKFGTKVKLGEQTFQILRVLLETPGELVTREELRAKLWADDTFVDFEHGLNSAIQRLRDCLSDSAGKPRWIETLPRRGYRFVGQVEWSEKTIANHRTHETPQAELTDSATWEADGEQKTGELTPTIPVFRLWRTALVATLVLLLVLSAAIAILLRHGESRNEPELRRISFGRGMIRSARFAPDGNVIYGAAWDGKPFQMFSLRPDGAESHSLSQQSLDILAVSPKGQLAVVLDRHFFFGFSSSGTLALMQPPSMEPRPLLADVQDADWSPSGDELAITHYVDDRCRLEFPVGTVVYQAVGGGWISHSRISPDGKTIAFLEHPLPGDSAGYLAVVDWAGNKRRLSGDFADVQGLAWDPSGQSVLFSGAEAGPGTGRSIYKTTLDGKQTLVRNDSSQLVLQDVSRGGQVLISRDVYRQEVFGRIYPDKQERNLGWQDNSYASYLSDDARTIVLSLQGDAAGSGYEVYIRGTGANATAIRLGEGLPTSLSPDGKWVLAVYPWGLKPSSPPQLTLLPVGLGKPKALTDDARTHDWGTWSPDGRILFVGSDSGHGLRNWVMNFDGTQAHPITPEGTIGTCVSAHGELLAQDPAGRFWLYPVNGDDRRPVSGMSGDDSPSRWSKDERTVYVAHPGEGTTDVYAVNLVTGRRTLLYRLAPTDRAGVTNAPSILITPDGRSYVYRYFRILSDLYSISNLN